MKRIFVPTLSASDWQRLLAQPSLHWRRGHSAMAAAACWEASNPHLPPEISSLLAQPDDPGLRDLVLLAALPEWATSLPGGGRASHTDVVALTRNELGLVVLAVEAKVDEQFGPTVGAKLKAPTSGQLKRIAYMRHELGMEEPIPAQIRYQLLHRTVSALLTARAFHASAGVMLVHSFSPTNKWRSDFDSFVDAVGAVPLTNDLYEIPLVGDQRLLMGWCRGSAKYLDAEIPGQL